MNAYGGSAKLGECVIGLLPIAAENLCVALDDACEQVQAASTKLGVPVSELEVEGPDGLFLWSVEALGDTIDRRGNDLATAVDDRKTQYVSALRVGAVNSSQVPSLVELQEMVISAEAMAKTVGANDIARAYAKVAQAIVGVTHPLISAGEPKYNPGGG